jgi:hypothetical protein
MHAVASKVRTCSSCSKLRLLTVEMCCDLPIDSSSDLGVTGKSNVVPRPYDKAETLSSISMLSGSICYVHKLFLVKSCWSVVRMRWTIFVIATAGDKWTHSEWLFT